jgi:hypothetical protein
MSKFPPGIILIQVPSPYEIDFQDPEYIAQAGRQNIGAVALAVILDKRVLAPMQGNRSVRNALSLSILSFQ